MEMAIAAVVRPEQKLLVISNGAFGDRLARDRRAAPHPHGGDQLPLGASCRDRTTCEARAATPIPTSPRWP